MSEILSPTQQLQTIVLSPMLELLPPAQEFVSHITYTYDIVSHTHDLLVTHTWTIVRAL